MYPSNSLLCRSVVQRCPFCKGAAVLTSHNDESVVISVHCPGARRDFLEVHEPPIAKVFSIHTQVLAYRRRNIQSGALVQIRFWTLISKYVLPVIPAKRAAIFPLCITHLVIMPDS